MPAHLLHACNADRIGLNMILLRQSVPRFMMMTGLEKSHRAEKNSYPKVPGKLIAPSAGKLPRTNPTSFEVVQTLPNNRRTMLREPRLWPKLANFWPMLASLGQNLAEFDMSMALIGRIWANTGQNCTGGPPKGVWLRILFQFDDRRGRQEGYQKRGRQEGASFDNPPLTTLVTTATVLERVEPSISSLRAHAICWCAKEARCTTLKAISSKDK